MAHPTTTTAHTRINSNPTLPRPNIIHFANNLLLLLHCPAASAADCATLLRDHGAPHVSVTTLDYVFGTSNPLYDPLAEKVGS